MRKIIKTVLLLAILSVTAWSVIKKVTAQGGATLSVLPPSVTVNVGQQTTLNINIANAANVYGFQLDIGYDDAVLDYVSWAQGSFMTQAGDANQPFWVNPQVSSGLLKQIAVTRISPDSSVSGSGTLLTVIFRGQTNGSSQVRIENAKFLDQTGNGLPITIQNSQVAVGSGDGGAATATPTTKPATATPKTTATATPQAAKCFGTNNTTDQDDVGVWLANYLKPAPDINNDGIVNGFEFIFLIANWLRKCL